MKKNGGTKAGRLLCAGGFLLLGACTSSSDGGAAADDIDPATLCVSAECGDKTALLTIPGAENILFAEDGRLFVSGNSNVYEITRDGEAYAATPLYEGSGNFTGLAIVGDVLYANCFDGRLYAARLDAHPALQPIHDLGLGAPNGLVDGPDGELFLVNGPLATTALPDPKIVRLKLDPADPFKVVEQSDWFRAGLLAPNGIQRRGRTLYVSNTGLTALGEIRSVEIADDGSAGASARFASFPGIPDDFSFAGDGVLAAFFVNGQIALFDAQGALLGNSALASFASPSQVKLGRPPLFRADDLLVTEKGLLVENGLPYGNRLSLFRRRESAARG